MLRSHVHIVKIIYSKSNILLIDLWISEISWTNLYVFLSVRCVSNNTEKNKVLIKEKKFTDNLLLEPVQQRRASFTKNAYNVTKSVHERQPMIQI